MGFESISGQEVSNTSFFGTPDAPWDLVRSRFDETLSKAEEVYTLLIGPDGQGGFLGDMNAALASAPTVSITAPVVDTSLALNATGLAVPTFDTSALVPFPSGTFPVPVMGELPTLGVLPTLDVLPTLGNLPTLEELPTLGVLPTLGPAPALGSLPSIDTNFSDIAEPGDVAVSIMWAEAPLPSTVYDAIWARMLTDLQSGATGLDPVVEAAIYQRARLRQAADRQAEWDRINNTAAQMQFQLPSGVLASSLTDFAIGATRQDADIENNIVVAQGELAQKNSQLMMQQAVALEQMIRQTRTDESGRALDAAKTLAQLIAEDFKTRVQRYVSIWEGRKTRVQAQVESLKGAIESNRGLIDIFKSELDAYKTESEVQVEVFKAAGSMAVEVYKAKSGIQVEAYKAESGVQVEAYKTESDVQVEVYKAAGLMAVEGFKAETQIFSEQNDALKTQVDAASAQNKNITDVYLGQVQGFGEAERAISNRNDSAVKLLSEQIKNADMALRAEIAQAEQLMSGYSTEQGIRQRFSSDIAQIAAQVVASMMSAVNAGASLGYSGNESTSKNFSMGAHLSESHSYEHDPTA